MAVQENKGRPSFLLLLRVPPPSFSSFLRSFPFSASFPRIRRGPRPPAWHARRLTYAWEGVQCALEKEDRERERSVYPASADTSSSRTSRSLRETGARRISKQFCLSIADMKGRKATLSLRNYRRAVLFELSLPAPGIKDANACHLASPLGKKARTAFQSIVNLMKRSFHLSSVSTWNYIKVRMIFLLTPTE